MVGQLVGRQGVGGAGGRRACGQGQQEKKGGAPEPGAGGQCFHGEAVGLRVGVWMGRQGFHGMWFAETRVLWKVVAKVDSVAGR